MMRCFCFPSLLVFFLVFAREATLCGAKQPVHPIQLDWPQHRIFKQESTHFSQSSQLQPLLALEGNILQLLSTIHSPVFEPSPACRRDLLTLFPDRYNISAITPLGWKYLDAWGKPPAGLLQRPMSIYLSGSYDECLGIQDHPHYCLAQGVNATQTVAGVSVVPFVHMGVCVPSSCAEKDILALVLNATSAFLPNLLHHVEVHCAAPTPWSTGANVALAICCAWVLLVIVGSVVHYRVRQSRIKALTTIHGDLDESSILASPQTRRSGSDDRRKNGRSSEEKEDETGGGVDSKMAVGHSIHFHEDMARSDPVSYPLSPSSSSKTAADSPAQASPPSPHAPSSSGSYRGPRYDSGEHVPLLAHLDMLNPLPRRPPPWVDFLCCFSILRQFPRLFSLSGRQQGIGCFEGVRTLSMLWVICGHTFLWMLKQRPANLGQFLALGNNLSFQFIINTQLAVDTFFFIRFDCKAGRRIRSVDRHNCIYIFIYIFIYI